MWFFHSMNLVCMGKLTIIISTNFVTLVQPIDTTKILTTLASIHL